MKKKVSDKAYISDTPIDGLGLSASDFAAAVLNNTSDAITAIDLKGEILFWNDGAATLSGYSAEEALGKHISMVYRKQDIPDLVERIKKAMQGEFFTNKELIMLDKDQKEHTVLLSLNGLKDESGKITKLIGFTKDITDLKRAERSIQESEQRFQQAFDNSPIPESILDLRTGKRLAVNKAFLDTFGYKEEDLLKEKNFIQTNIAVDQSAFKLAVKKVLKEGSLFEFPFSMYTKSGEIRHTLVNATRVYPENKDVYITSYLDVTERKKSEHAWIRAKEDAERSGNFLDNILNNIGDPVFVKDDQSRLILVNDAFCKLFDLTRENILGKTLAEDVSAEEMEAFLKIDRQVLETGEENIIEEELTVRGGPTKTIYTRKSRYVDANGKKHLIGVIRDITERKNAESELRRAQEIANVGNWFLDLSTGEISWSDELFKIYGFDPDLPIPPLSEHEKSLTPESWELLNRSIEHTSKTGEPYAIELQTTKKEGDDHWHWFYAQGEAVLDSENKIVALRGTAQDITDRKLAEEHLKESEASISAILNSLQATVCVIDDTGKILQVNDSWKEFGELNGMPNDTDYYIDYNYFDVCRQDIQNEDARTILNGLFGLLENKIKEFEHEYPCHSPDKKQWFSMRANTMKSIKKQIVISHIDITKRKLIEERLEQANIDLSNAVTSLNELKQQIEAENIYLKEELKLEGGFNEIVGSSRPVRKMLKQVQQVAKTDTTVLVLGETGTGKELIARAIHNSSDRKDKPLVKVNCSALPSELIESEFFGHEAGAFTSAIARKIGRFELANGGTIFLDEIGDLPLGLQTRLLRVLQESEFERVGGEQTIKVNVRVITATNRNLEEEVRAGNFRQDLYYRLNVFPIECPPLRERIDDVPILVNHFVNKYNHKLHKNITKVNQKTIDRLMAYKWPGNIRELEHVIERAVILNEAGGPLRLGSWFMDRDLNAVVSDELTTMENVERDYINKVLDRVNWKIRGKYGAAEILGLKPTTLESRMKKLNISRNK